MRRVPIRLAAATVALLVVPLSGCGADDPDPDADLVKVTAAAIDLNTQVRDTVNRLVVNCLTARGFDVQAPDLTEPTRTDGTDPTVISQEPPEAYQVPAKRDAKAEGFGRNIFRHDAAGVTEESGLATEEDDSFESESEDYRRDYGTARYGADYYSYLTSGDDTADPPPLAGCEGETGKAVFGDSATTSGSGDAVRYGIAIPDGVDDPAGIIDEYADDDITDARADLSECIADDGYPEFEYDPGDGGWPMAGYADAFYAGSGVQTDYPLPPGAPWSDFDTGFEAESALAQRVAVCGKDTGYLDEIQSRWDETLSDTVSRPDVQDWHDSLETALRTAQQLMSP